MSEPVTKNITIIGGGTAGWLTALTMLQAGPPDHKIVLIESDEVGILGAGEGTVPFFPTHMFRVLGLDFYDFYKRTNATFKYGTRFVNWNNDGKDYLNSFTHPNKLDLLKRILESVNKKQPIKDNCFFYKNLKNTPFSYNKQTGTYDMIMPYAFHFDAILLAEYLKEVAIARGAIRIEGKVKAFKSDNNGNINNIILESGQQVKTSFLFDCTGFKRMIIGEYYRSNWISYAKHLPAKKAIAFQHKIDLDNYNNCTDAIAMKYGWMWKIPLQSRYGSGYVFDSDHITPDGAKKEVEQLLGHEIDVARTFSFEAGMYGKICVKNCIAVGLSTGFAEPLEATSLWATLMLLEAGIKQNFKNIFINVNDQKPKDALNNFYAEIVKQFLPAIQVHYLTKRKDTPFWKDFKKNNVILDSITELIKRHKTIPLELDPLINESKAPPFGVEQWTMIFEGQGLLNKKLYPSSVEKVALMPQPTWELLIKDPNRSSLLPNNMFNKTISKDWKFTGF